MDWVVWYVPRKGVAEDVQFQKVDSPSLFFFLVVVVRCVCWLWHYLICGSERVLFIASFDLESYVHILFYCRTVTLCVK